MRRATSRVFGLALAACAIAAPPGAWAEPQSDEPGEHHERHRHHEHGKAEEPPSGAAGDAGMADDEGDEAEDAGPPIAITRTPEQTELREHVIKAERERLHDFAHAKHRHLTMQERQAMGMHWRHVMRLLRIRELADAAKDTASVQKVDALLERETKKFAAHLGALGEAMDGGAR